MKASKQKSFSLITRFDQGIGRWPDQKVGGLFKLPPRGDWQSRFSIYGTGYAVRSRDAMEEMFQLLPRLISKRQWEVLGAEYCMKHPSTSSNLSDLGYGFSKFLARKKLSKLSRVAAFEIEVSRVFHSFDEALQLAPEIWQQISERTKFKFRSCVRILKNADRIAEAWLHFKDKPRLKKGDEKVILFRTDEKVCVRILSTSEFRILKRLEKGLSFSRALSKERLDSEELSTFLRTWMADQIFSEIR